MRTGRSVLARRGVALVVVISAATLALLAAETSTAIGAALPSPTSAGNPFSGGVSPLAPTPTTTTTTTPTTVPTNSTTGSGSGSLSGGGAIAIAGGALALLAGISFFIWRDARRRAPVRSSAGGGLDREGRSHPGSKSAPKPRKPSAAERRRRKRGRARR